MDEKNDLNIAYKLVRLKLSDPGKPYPLYVLTENPIPFGVWVSAQEGKRLENGKVKARTGSKGGLSYRPGWHLSDIPLATHIGKTNKNDNSRSIHWMHEDEVWCECRYSSDINYQAEADSRGWENGKFSTVRAQLDHIPENGYYRYKTNPSMLGKWIIAGKIMVVRILSDDEVAKICRSKGYEPLPRENPLDKRLLGEYNLAQNDEIDAKPISVVKKITQLKVEASTLSQTPDVKKDWKTVKDVEI